VTVGQAEPMATASDWILLHGRPEPPEEARTLSAGPLTMLLRGTDLVYLRHGEMELARRIYMAVRDLNWNTIAGEVRDRRVEEREDGFRVTFVVRHRRGPIDFEWEGEIAGEADGTVTYAMSGMPRAVFDYAKIGLCVHHPVREHAGRIFTGRAPEGPVGGTLPLDIGPQIHVDEGWDLPLFDPVWELRIALPDGSAVAFDFEGDLWEMEDQRNWTDASYKSASTPAHLGYVHHAKPGVLLRQRVTVRHEAAGPPRTARSRRDRIVLGGETGRFLPAIGFGMASDRRPLSSREAGLISALRPAHLRADVRPGDGADALAGALEACTAVGAGLELALFLGDDADEQLDAVTALLAGSAVSVSRVIALREGEEASTGPWVRRARDRLAPAVPDASFAGGTDVYFNELNRNRPDVGAMDAVAYSVNPQMHAFDETSLVEALGAQGDTVLAARRFCGDLAIAVTPVTLRPRFSAAPAAPALAAEAPELPSAVDPRQMSRFCAAWTVGSVAALAGAGAASLTYYETVGWRGLLEREDGSPAPDLFRSRPGEPFPVYDAFGALAGWRGAALLEVIASDPLRLAGLALRGPAGTRLVLANLTPGPLAAHLEPIGERAELGPYDVTVIDLEERGTP